jgi:hypothetical protein
VEEARGLGISDTEPLRQREEENPPLQKTTLEFGLAADTQKDAPPRESGRPRLGLALPYRKHLPPGSRRNGLERQNTPVW